MIQVANFEPGLDLFLHIRTTIRYEYSFIESAALRIGEDTFEVESFGQYSLNEVDNASLNGVEATVSGFRIYHSRPNEKEHVFDVVISPTENITISTFKDWVSVGIHGGTRAHFGSSAGIMGSFDGIMTGRNGTAFPTGFHPNTFGQEWQVLPEEPLLFRTIRDPQAPVEKCRLPSPTLSSKKMLRHRHLGESAITRESAENACSHLPDGNNKDACVFDGMFLLDHDDRHTSLYLTFSFFLSISPGRRRP